MVRPTVKYERLSTVENIMFLMITLACHLSLSHREMHLISDTRVCHDHNYILNECRFDELMITNADKNLI